MYCIAGHCFWKSWLLHMKHERIFSEGPCEALHPQTLSIGEGRGTISLLAPIIQVLSLEVLTILHFWVSYAYCCADPS